MKKIIINIQKGYIMDYNILQQKHDGIQDLKLTPDNLTRDTVVVNKINALPKVIKLSDKTAIDDAIMAYNELTSEQKLLVNNINYLEDAIAALEKVFNAYDGFSKYGNLSVIGTDLVDKNLQKVQLFGLSTHGFNFFPQFINYNTFANVKTEFGINTIRLAMYTSQKGGYCQDNGIYQNELKTMMVKAINDITSLDMYAIVDWHIVGAEEVKDKNPLNWINEASSFFNYISKKFKDNENILYEICNEPNGTTTWDDIKKYANIIIPIIRNNNPKAIIIVGTPNYSSDLDSVIKNPIKFDNIMYTYHFYADTHKESHRKMVETAYNNKLPIFVTEHALMNSQGYGSINLESGKAWYDLLDNLNISYIAWNISTGPRECSILKVDAPYINDFSNEYLKTWGIWLKEFYRSKAGLSE